MPTTTGGRADKAGGVREGPPTTSVVAPARIGERMRARRAEIEEALRVRVFAISDPIEAADHEYADGLRSALEAALEYGLTGIEAGAEHLPPIPPTLVAQARVAARSGVSLDTVLRRYFGGYALLGDFLIEAAQVEGVSTASLKRILRAQATLFDRLIAEVSEEYVRESESGQASAQQRRLACVRRLLAGELAEVSELNYELDAWHLGVIARGAGAVAALGKLAATLDCRLLILQGDESTAWAWFGGRRALEPEEVTRGVSADSSKQLTIAIGESAQGLAGFRVTHRQAMAALPVALASSGPITRYGDVALLASAMRDEVLKASLHQIYIVPLSNQRGGGTALRETLLAYFAAHRNVSATAASLGISRQTVNSRLRAVEKRVGRPLSACGSEIEVALGLERLYIRRAF